MVIGLKFLLAFCGFVYELMLAQALSVFMDNTVLRYSTTIGLYMFAMGIGAVLSTRVERRHAALSLWRTEVLLTLAGPMTLAGLFCCSGPDIPAFATGIVAYGGVALIGILVGLELPLLLCLSGNNDDVRRGTVLAADYAGAFAGMIGFVFLFYPGMGLLPGVMSVACLNAAAALAAAWYWRDEMQDSSTAIPWSGLLLVVTLVWVLLSSPLQERLLMITMKGTGGV